MTLSFIPSVSSHFLRQMNKLNVLHLSIKLTQATLHEELGVDKLKGVLSNHSRGAFRLEALVDSLDFGLVESRYLA